MSLLEKAIRGTGTSEVQPRSSLFSRALAARAPEPEAVQPATATPSISFDASNLEGLELAATALPATFDSLLAVWSLITERVPVAAIALFLPRDGFLTLAAQNGFPSGPDADIPLSVAGAPRGGVLALEQDARALIAPTLGVPLSLSLGATAMKPRSGEDGLWVYHDPALDADGEGGLAKLDECLSRVAAALPSFPMTAVMTDPAGAALDAASSFPSASVLAFDLSVFDIERDPRFRGLSAGALRSSFMAACGMILAKGGATLAVGELEALCVLGSAPTLDPDLALFQFTKTLKRILPYMASSSFPRGRALRLDPRSDSALEELRGFLSE